MEVTAVEAPQRRTAALWPLLVATTAAGGGLALWALAGFNPFAAPILVLAMATAAAVAILTPARPASAVGLVFFIAIFERVALETPVGAMRVEQPAIVALMVAAIWHRHQLHIGSLRDLWPLLIAGGVYLAALAASSVLVAEVPAASLRIVVWSGLSMAAGLGAAVLLRDRVRPVIPWIVAAAAFTGLMGLLVAISYLLFGRWSEAVGGAPGAARVFLPAFEPNLYASLVATVVPLAAEQYRAQATRRNLLLLALPLLALGLGITRAAYIALVVGMLLFVVLHLRRDGLSPALRRTSTVVAAFGLIGFMLPALVLNASYAGLLRPAVDTVSNPGSGGSGGAIGDPMPPGVEPLDDLDTLEYRLTRVRTGMDEWQQSPIIGRGAYSYGQRHIDNRGFPEVIAVLPVLVLHDSGIVGLAALSAFLALLAIRVWRASGSEEVERRAPAIAFGAAVVVMLVTYLSTSALHFAVTWLLIGCAVAASWPRRAPSP